MRAGDRPGPRAGDVVVSVEGLGVTFPSRGPALRALDGVSLQVRSGECVGVVGESGSGKTLLAMSLLGIVPERARTVGAVWVCGVDTLAATPRQLDRLRSRHLGLVMQDPTPSLNPIRRIGSQLRETARAAGLPKASWRGAVDRCLRDAELDPDEVRDRYPYELSGGMNQRVCIAMAMLHEPQLLVADEPTTALDVTTQAALLRTIAALQARRGMAFVFVSHDLALVSQVADRVAVLYAGSLVEVGPTVEIVTRPSHPYTTALLGALPHVDPDGPKELVTIPGSLRPQHDGDTGCPFAERCREARPECGVAFPPVRRSGDSHAVWCWARQEDDALAGAGGQGTG